MSNPHSGSSSSTNTNKLSSSSSSNLAAGEAPYFSPMKKAKSQAVACSIDSNKNGLQQHVRFDDNDAMIDDPNLNDVVDPSPSVIRASAGGITANLARKKATPPQPAKKLVIKLNKGVVL